MSIAVHCAHCNGCFSAPDSALEKTAVCPKCGYEITIQPPAEFEAPPVIQVSQTDIERATRARGSWLNAVAVGFAVGVALLAVSIVSYLILKADQPMVSMASRDTDPSPKSIDNDITQESVAGEFPLESLKAQPEVGEEQYLLGLGFSLEEFKTRFPIGEHWKVLSDTVRGDGTVSFQLLSTDMRLVMLIVSGNPDNLREVSVIFSAVEGQSEAETVARIVLMETILAKYSDWTIEEINEWWTRCINIGEDNEDEDRFHVQKNGQRLWMGPMAVQGGTMFMNGVIAESKSTAPTLQEWLDAHPLPRPKSGKDHYHGAESTGKVANARFSFKNFRRKRGNEFIGELVNDSGRHYQAALFTLSMYDETGALIDTDTITIMNFKADEVRSFDAFLEDVPNYFSYKFDLEQSF